jgi:predicted RNase H-like HicB family nuclease
MEGAIVYYLVIAFRHWGWVAVLPDFVGVTGRAEDVAKAIQRAVVAARSALEALKAVPTQLPVPSNLDAVQRNYAWAKEQGIDWSKAVVSTVSWHLDDLTDKDQAQSPQKTTADGRQRNARRSGFSFIPALQR